MSLQYLDSQNLNIECINLSCNTINGLPPGGGGSQNLQQVLTIGNDAGGLSITGVDNLTVSQLNYTTLNPPIAPPTPPLSTVLSAGNTLLAGQFIDASGLGATAIDATGSDIISQNLSVEKITPLGAPIITNITVDGGLTLQTGGNYRIEFEDEIRIGKGLTDFIYSNPSNELIFDTTLASFTGDITVNTLNYTTLNPAITPGDPNITYQTTYANLGTDDLQTAINTLAGATRKQLIISNGAWTPTGGITFNNLDTVGLVGATSITPLTRITPSSGGFTLSGASSTRNQFSYLSFGDTFTINGTLGRHTWKQCDFLNGLTITGTTTNFLIFDNCSFSGGSINIPITFGAVVFFRNCDFTGISAINLNNPMATQVVFLACVGVNPVNTAKATFIAWNDVNGTSRADAYDVNATNVNSVNGTFSDGTTTINIDPLTTKGIEISNGVGQGKIKLVDTDGDEIEIQNTEIDVYHSASLNQTDRYYQLKDSVGNEVDWYIGGTTPTHVASKGSIFVETSTPSIYQSNGGGVWNAVGGGSSIVGSYSVPCISKSTVGTGLTLSTTPQIVLFNTDVINTPASWINAPVSGVWNVPFSGVYTLSASLSITGTGTNSVRAVFYINGGASGSRDIELINNGDNWLFIQYTTQLSVGDTVDLRMSSNTNTPTATFNATGSYATWQAYRLDPLTISSTIYIPKLSKWRGSANYSLSPVGVPNQILFGNPDILIPSASWVNATTGQMEVLESGVYYVFASLRFATEAVDKTVNARIYVNGSQVGRDVEYFNVSFPNPIITVSGVFSLNANDIITIWADTIQASGGSTVNGTDESTYYYVEKISV
jgi:hypothetical protein